MHLLAQVGKFLLLSLVGFSFPRLLISLGVPLDVWIERLGAHAGATIWLFAIVFAFAAFWFDGKYNILEQLFYASRPVRLTEAQAVRFVQLLDDAGALINEIPTLNLTSAVDWQARVLGWNEATERLIEDTLPTAELIAFRSVTLPFAQGQPLPAMAAHLAGRRNKLRTMTMRLLPSSFGRRQ